MFNTKFDEKNRIWGSCDIPPVLNPNISIGHIVLKSLRVNGPKIAQISDNDGIQLSFDEMRIKTIRAAQNLQNRGYEAKQVFGFMADNVAHLAPIAFAAFCLGCPINPMFSTVEKQDIIRMFQLSKPSVVFCEARLYDLVVECLNKLGNKIKIFTFNGTRGDSEAVENLFTETGTEENFVPADIDGVNDVAAIMSSSGTTGPFKGIRISHATLISHIGDLDVINVNDVIFSPSTLHWPSGVLALLLATINGVTRIITTEAIPPESWVRIIEKYKVTIAFSPALRTIEILKSNLLAKADLSSIRHMFTGGWKMPHSVMAEFNSYLPNGSVNNGYGMTEMGSYIAIDYPKFSGRDVTGRLLNRYAVKIIDEKGNRLGVDEDGEICVKARYKFLGYCNSEEFIDNEGFILTGDIGHIDKDGYLYILGRKKDIIHYNIMVLPVKMEEFLFESPGIRNVCIVGVPFNKSIELPAAVVVREKNSNITEEDICKMIADNFPDHCHLRGGVFFVESIPKTQSQKIFRLGAKAAAAELYKAKQQKNSIQQEMA